MKKALLLFVACSFLLSGCISIEVEEPADGAVTVASGENTPTESTEGKAAVLIDDDVVKVTFVEIFEVDGLSGACYLRLRVDNKSDQKISVYLMDAYVNDMAVTMMSGVPMDIMPGKASQNPFFFTGFTKDEVEKIEFKVHLYDENMDTIEETDTVEVRLK